MPVLSKYDIQRLIKSEPPLVEGWLNLDEQVQANGFDLSLRDIAVPQTAGKITAANSQRVLPDCTPLVFDAMGNLELVPGIYTVTYNEVVNLPKHIMALGRPRSSLLRCGVSIGTAVWDAGYCGRSQSMMIVYNPRGFTVQKDARITQLVFFELTGETEGYNGFYQGENT